MTVGSLHTTMTYRPWTIPIPVIMPAPGESPPYMSSAASGATSRNGDPSIQQGIHAVARQQLAAVHVALPGFLRTALCRRGQTLTQFGNQVLLLNCVLEKTGVRGIDAAGQSLHISSFLVSTGEARRERLWISGLVR